MPSNRQIRLKRRPQGLPSLEDFELVESPIPQPGDGQILIHNLSISLDPYMRGRMDEQKSYATPVALGDVMTALTVGEVVESRSSRFSEGDVVFAPGNWQEYAVISAENQILRKLDPKVAPVTTALGVLGAPAGASAYVGLLDIGRPKAGETLIVSSAAGAVGSLVGQIGKIKGCRVVGIAGGPEKCRYVVEELGFDACIDHKSPTMSEELARACPNGVDIDFENVGGPVMQALWPLLNDFARVVLCGLIAQYNDSVPTPWPGLQFNSHQANHSAGIHHRRPS
jgi:NADPH-dependent curcumin reductase CurA